MDRPLEEQHCKACEGDIDPMNKNEIKTMMTQIPEWKANEKGTAITRKFTFKNFYRTMSFVNALAHVVNQENHHPDLQVGYNYCTVFFTTHAIKGLSQNDFICARKIDRLSL